MESRISGFGASESPVGINMVGLVVFSIVLGLVIASAGEKGLPVRNFIESLQFIILKIVVLVIWCVFSHIAVFPLAS